MGRLVGVAAAVVFILAPALRDEPVAGIDFAGGFAIIGVSGAATQRLGRAVDRRAPARPVMSRKSWRRRAKRR